MYLKYVEIHFFVYVTYLLRRLVSWLVYLFAFAQQDDLKKYIQYLQLHIPTAKIVNRVVPSNRSNKKPPRSGPNATSCNPLQTCSRPYKSLSNAQGPNLLQMSSVQAT